MTMLDAAAMDDLYQEIILDHYRSPRNRGPGAEHTHEAHHSNPLCGDELTVRVDLDDDAVKDVAWEGHGCSISQASASMMSEAVRDLAPAQAQALVEKLRRMMHGEPPDDDLGDAMALEGVARFPVRIKCALLAWMALRDALEQAGYDAPKETP
jgi:nitrogen fixation NifU-like protein